MHPKKNLKEWLYYISQVHPANMELGLERVKRVASCLNLLSPKYKVITVAGTNGKGTTAGLLELSYRYSGYSTGLFTSPHLIQFNERITIDGRMVADEQIVQAFEAIEAVRGDTLLTFFEYTFLASLYIFNFEPLDVVVLEVGLGGRLDAVNIIDADVAVITTIGIDHTNILGETREQIGYEKSGVFRPKRPAICGDLDCPRSIIDHARKIGTHLYRQGEDYTVTVGGDHWQWQSLTQRWPNLPFPAVPLQNAATVLMAINVLRDKLPVNIDAFSHALEQIRVPGRFQVLEQHCTIILDVAHNVEACVMLVDNLRAIPCEGNTYAVFSSLKDKDVPGMLTVLREVIDHWYVAPLSVERALPRDNLRQLCMNLPVNFYSDVRQAFHTALNRAGPDDRVVVCGSFYVLTEAFQMMRESCDAG